jgi:sugar lactone lactonase YvrE
LPSPIRVGSRKINKIVFNAPAKSGLKSHGNTVVMQPCTMPMFVSGLSKTAREKLAAALEPYNVEVMAGAGGGRKQDFKGTPLVPGAAFSMMLATGDFEFPATGTVTYREKDRMLGFGHPFLNIGAIEAPIASAYIYDVYPLQSASYKISSAGPVVGASIQDRNFSVSGTIGKAPAMIPVTVDVRDVSTGRSKVFHSQIVNHPNLTAALISTAASAAVGEIRNTPGAAFAKITTTADIEEVGKITRTNTAFHQRAIDIAATNDLDDLLSQCTSNPFHPLTIKNVDLKVEIANGRPTAQIERIFVKEGKFEPGGHVEVGVVIRPYKGIPVTRTMNLDIPKNAPSGRFTLVVRGGSVGGGLSLGGIIIRPQGQGDQAPPANVRQVMDRYLEREKNTEIVARLLLPGSTVNVDGAKMTDLPQPLDALMRSAKTSSVRLERDEVRVVMPTEWVISDAQAVAVTIQRKDVQESPSGLPPVGGTGSPVSRDRDDDFSVIGGQVGNQNDRALAEINSLELKTLQLPGDDTNPPAAKQAPAAQQPTGARPGTGKTQAVTTPGVAPGPPAIEPTVVRLPSVWKQGSSADFLRGESQGIAVTSQGELTLTPALTRVKSLEESFVWCLTPDGKGGVYAGTGSAANVLQVSADGKTRTVAKLPEVSIYSLLAARDGTIWAGVGPSGKVYRIKPDGTFAVAFQATGSKYCLSLAEDGSGTVYAGFGGGSGVIYRIGADGKATQFFNTNASHVMRLAVGSDGSVYAGTSAGGTVYRISQAGEATALYDSPSASITGLAVAANGDVYAGTAPRGAVYRLSKNNPAKAVLDRLPAAVTALTIGSNGTLFVSAGSKVWGVRPDDVTFAVDSRSDVDITALATEKDGAVFVGTSNVGEIYVARPLGTDAKGEFVSVVHDAKQPALWGSSQWSASARDGEITVYTRTGNVAEPDSTWSGWAATSGDFRSGKVSSPEGRYLQYKIELKRASGDRNPAVRDIAFAYAQHNQAPVIAFQAPKGGERWGKQQSVRWSATDADGDTLSFDLQVSSDDGKTWMPLPGPAAKPVTDPAVKPIGTTPPVEKPETQSPEERFKNLPPALRDALIQRERENAAQGGGQANAGSASPAASSRSTIRVVDTRLLPDGVYRLKLVATDRPSNAIDPAKVEAISESFTVSNKPPTLGLLRETLKIAADRTVSIEGIATQTLATITAVQFRIDNGEWLAAAPSDGVYDTETEAFVIRTDALPVGKHVLEVRAYNSTGNAVTEKREVDVK